MSREFSPRTDQPACARFTPSKSGQRSPPTYYRGCWHVVSRGLFAGYRQGSSPAKGLYDPRAFFTHAALLRQAFAHCARFLAAASRRSLGRVSVPVWLIILSDQLPMVVLVGRYPTNKLIGRRPLPRRRSFPRGADPASSWGISSPFDGLFPTSGQVTYALLSRLPLSLRPEGRASFDLHA